MEVVLYTLSRGCPLCEDALAHLRDLGRAIPFDLRVVPVDQDPHLAVRHALRVPVVEIDGREALFGRIERDPLEAALRAAARVRPAP